MILVIYLLSAISGILAASKNLLSVLIVLILIFFIYKNKYKKLHIPIIIFIIFVLITFWLKRAIPTSQLFGVVYKSSENYSLVLTINGNFYIEESGLEVGDLVTIKGKIEKLAFSNYQESFDFVSYLNSHACFHSFEVSEFKTVFKNPIRPLYLKRTLLSFIPIEYQALVSSYIFGDSSEISSKIPSLSYGSLISVFRLSGLHITYLFSLIDKYLGRKINDSKKIKKIELSILSIFLILNNYRLALFRILVSRVLRLVIDSKGTNLINITLTSIILILINPFVIYQMSFYLVIPLLFLLHFLNMSTLRFKGIFKTVYKLVIIYLYFIPFSIVQNYGIAPLSSLLRIIYIPLGQVGFIISLLSLLPFGEMLLPSLLGIEKVVQFVSSLNIVLYTGSLSSIWILFYYSTLIVTIFFIEIWNVKFFRISSLILISSFVLPIVPIQFDHYEVHFIDVGQGDATLVRIKDENYLIDTGGNKYVDLATQCLIPYFHKLRIDKIDKVYITHTDYDHVGALDSLIENFKVGEVSYGGDETFIDLNNYKDDSKDLNYNSSVYYFTLKNVKFLVMGDAPIEVENKIIKDYQDLKVDVLKVGHHGSSTSSSFDFLYTTKPTLAIISCGYDNFYGHPHQKVLTNLSALGIEYRLTSEEGTIVYKV